MQKKTYFWTKIVILMGFSLFLCGCGGTARAFLPELDHAFSCDVSGECGGVPFSGIVTAGEWVTDESGNVTRDLKIVYTESAYLRGLVAARQGGVCTLTLDGMEIENAALGGFLLPARLLGDGFAVTESRVEKGSGGNVTAVMGTGENATRVVKIQSENGTLLSVEGTIDGVFATFEVHSLQSGDQKD